MKKGIYTLLSILVLSSCGSNTAPEVKEAMQEDSMKQGNKLIVDVRTKEEWDSGHKDCSEHYPLDDLQTHEQELKQYDTVFFVCQSGGRAEHATSYMQRTGGSTVYINAGSWEDLPCK